MQDAIEGYRFDVPQGRLTGDVYLEEWQFFPFKYQDKTHLIISFFAPRIAILPCCPANSLITRLLWAWQSFVLGLYLPYIAIKTTIFKGFRGLLEHFWVQKTESIEQNGLFSAQCLVISVFFSLFANEIRGTFRNYVPTQCQIRPDVVPDTSRRSIKYIPTYSQVHPNAYSSTCERYFKYLRTLLLGSCRCRRESFVSALFYYHVIDFPANFYLYWKLLPQPQLHQLVVNIICSLRGRH